MKLSEYLRLLWDSIMCDIEFCTSAQQIVETVNEHFDEVIKRQKKLETELGEE